MSELQAMHKNLERNPNSKYIKYTESDITNPSFTSRLEKTVLSMAPNTIRDFISGQNTSKRVEVPVKKDCSISIYGSSIVRELKKFITTISANDPNFSQRIKESIKKDALSQGIDPEKYCFDTENVKLLLKAEETAASQPKKEVPKQSVQSKAPTQAETEIYHRPAGTPMSYKPMTDEEIRESQRKLMEHPPVKVKK